MNEEIPGSAAPAGISVPRGAGLFEDRPFLRDAQSVERFVLQTLDDFTSAVPISSLPGEVFANMRHGFIFLL